MPRGPQRFCGFVGFRASCGLLTLSMTAIGQVKIVMQAGGSVMMPIYQSCAPSAREARGAVGVADRWPKQGFCSITYFITV